MTDGQKTDDETDGRAEDDKGDGTDGRTDDVDGDMMDKTGTDGRTKYIVQKFQIRHWDHNSNVKVNPEREGTPPLPTPPPKRSDWFLFVYPSR